jgi:hypothetical protein
MSIIRVEVDINAPAAVCFDMARSVDAHIESARTTGERAVAGVTSGMLTLGDEVTWRAGAQATRRIRRRQGIHVE